jgi:hypothetical protein
MMPWSMPLSLFSLSIFSLSLLTFFALVVEIDFPGRYFYIIRRKKEFTPEFKGYRIRLNTYLLITQQSANKDHEQIKNKNWSTLTSHLKMFEEKLYTQTVYKFLTHQIRQNGKTCYGQWEASQEIAANLRQVRHKLMTRTSNSLSPKSAGFIAIKKYCALYTFCLWHYERRDCYNNKRCVKPCDLESVKYVDIMELSDTFVTSGK